MDADLVAFAFEVMDAPVDAGLPLDAPMGNDGLPLDAAMGDAGLPLVNAAVNAVNQFPVALVNAAVQLPVAVFAGNQDAVDDVVLHDPVDDDDDLYPWKPVISKRMKKRMKRLGRARPVNPVAEKEEAPEYVCMREVEWIPKSAPLREVKKWAQVRKGGMVHTPEGLAVLVYPCFVPPSMK